MVEVEIFEIKKTNKKAPDARDLLLENNRLEKEMLYLKKKKKNFFRVPYLEFQNNTYSIFLNSFANSPSFLV